MNAYTTTIKGGYILCTRFSEPHLWLVCMLASMRAPTTTPSTQLHAHTHLSSITTLPVLTMESASKPTDLSDPKFVPLRADLVSLIYETPLPPNVRRALWLMISHERSRSNAAAKVKKAGAGAGAGAGARAGANAKKEKTKKTAKRERKDRRTKRKRTSSPAPAPAPAPASAPAPAPAPGSAPRLQDVGSFNVWFSKVFPNPYTDTICKACRGNSNRFAVALGPKVCPHVYAAAKRRHPQSNWPAGIKDIKCSDCRCSPGDMHHPLCSARAHGYDFTWS